MPNKIHVRNRSGSSALFMYKYIFYLTLLKSVIATWPLPRVLPRVYVCIQLLFKRSRGESEKGLSASLLTYTF